MGVEGRLRLRTTSLGGGGIGTQNYLPGWRGDWDSELPPWVEGDWDSELPPWVEGGLGLRTTSLGGGGIGTQN